MLTKTPTEEEFMRLTAEISIALTDNTSNSHIERAKKLGSSPSNSGHCNWLTGVIVQADFEAPQYWWIQAQRYHWFQIVSSQSKMHKLLEMDLDETCEPTTCQTAIDITKEYTEFHKLGQCDLDVVLSNTPLGLETTARVYTNYLQLLNMYNQRKNHRLYMWNTVFKQWVEQLPYFRELTGIKEEC
jgi:hypothetical protein